MEDDVDGDYSDDENDILQLNQVEESPSVDQTPIVKDLPKVDPEAWKEEVERLAPQLKVFYPPEFNNITDVFRLHSAQTRKIGDKELIN